MVPKPGGLCCREEGWPSLKLDFVWRASRYIEFILTVFCSLIVSFSPLGIWVAQATHDTHEYIGAPVFVLKKTKLNSFLEEVVKSREVIWSGKDKSDMYLVVTLLLNSGSWLFPAEGASVPTSHELFPQSLWIDTEVLNCTAAVGNTFCASGTSFLPEEKPLAGKADSYAHKYRIQNMGSRKK